MLVFLVLLAVIVPIVVVTPLQDSVVLPKLATTAVFTSGALLWGAVLLARDRWPAGRWPVSLWAALVAFVVVNLLALAFAVDWRGSLMGEHLRYQGLATTILYVLLFGVAAVAVRTVRDLRWLLLGLFAGALGAAIYALIQKAGLDWVEWSGQALDRPASTLGQANAFGAFLVAAMCGSAFLVATAGERWQRAALGAGLLAMLFALLFTVSRSAYLGAGVAVLLGGLAAARWFLPAGLERRLRAGVGAAAALPLLIALIAVLVAGLPQGRVAVAGDADSEAVEGRLSLWRLGLEMTADRPLFGHGHDGFSIQFPAYRDRPDLAGIGTKSVDPESAHNFFLDLASGTGVLGLVAFLALVGAVLWHAGRRVLATDDGPLRLALVALSAGVVGYLVAILFGFSEAMTSWVFWLLLGAMVGLLAQVPADARPNDQLPAPADGLPDDELSVEAGTLASGMAAVALTVVGVIALGWAVTITTADLAAGQADRAASRGEYADAARLAGRAAVLNPIQKEYLVQQGDAYQASAADASDEEDASAEADMSDEADGSAEADASAEAEVLRKAVASYEKALGRYEPEAYPTLRLAEAYARLAEVEGTPIEYVVPLFERALQLDPFNKPLRESVADVYDRYGLGERAFGHRLIIYCWTEECELFPPE